MSEFERRRTSGILTRYCEEKVPSHVRGEVQLRFRFEGNAVLLYEYRPPWDGAGDWVETMVAKFRYFVGRREWALYWRDRNERWQRYDLIDASRVFDDLLDEVDADPTGIFWG
jgi:hypothetical protein